MAEKEVRSIRLPKPEAERVEQYADDAEMTEADAYRRLVRVGLDTDDPEQIAESTTTRRHNMIPGNKPLLAFVTLDTLMTAALLMGGF
jgi:hypothetical protein